MTETAAQGATPTESYGNFGLTLRVRESGVRKQAEVPRMADSDSSGPGQRLAGTRVLPETDTPLYSGIHWMMRNQLVMAMNFCPH